MNDTLQSMKQKLKSLQDTQSDLKDDYGKQFNDTRQVILTLQDLMNENGFGEVDRTYMRDIGETVD